MPVLPTPLTPADRVALGLAARKQCPRSGHCEFALSASTPKKPHDPLALLHESEKDRIQSLVAVKHQRMAISPFGFFRGAVPIMAADLAAQPNTGLITQLCGDAHLSNLGAYAALDGRLTFDINDFDETIRGPFEFDIKRLATSIVLGGRVAGIKLSDRKKAVLHFTAQYRRLMHKFAAMPVAELARYQIHRLAHIPPMPAIFAQSRRSTVAKTLASLTEVKVLTRIFKTDTLTPHLLQRITGKERDLVLASLGPYSRTLPPERRHFFQKYRAVDVGFKVVGTGSVGLRDYIVYFEGTHSAADPLFLQVKEEPASAYQAYLPESSQHTQNGQRVMDGQRAMQLTSDPFLGYTTIPDLRGKARDYLVRQLNDHKASLDLTTLNAASLFGYADLCGELFARGHARAGDPVAIAAYLGTSSRFDDAIRTFAHNYADQTETYWKVFKKEFAGLQRHKAKSNTR